MRGRGASEFSSIFGITVATVNQTPFRKRGWGASKASMREAMCQSGVHYLLGGWAIVAISLRLQHSKPLLHFMVNDHEAIVW